MLTNIEKTDYPNTGLFSGNILNGTVQIRENRFISDYNCSNCANRKICKYIDYYTNLISTVQKIKVEPVFELRLWCNSYKSDTTSREITSRSVTTSC